MRWPLVLLLVARAAAADDGPQLPPATYHVVVLDGAHVGCEAWTVTADTIARPDGTRIAFSVGDAWLHLSGATHGTDHAAWKRDLPLADYDDTFIKVDTAHWFISRERCEAAIAHKDPVAVDLDDWRIPPPVDRKPIETLLGGSGSLYKQDECTRIAVRGRLHDGRITGALISVYDDAESHTVTKEPYELVPGSDKIEMFPSDVHTTMKRRDAIPPGRYSCVCVDEAYFTPGTNSVAMFGTVY